MAERTASPPGLSARRRLAFQTLSLSQHAFATALEGRGNVSRRRLAETRRSSAAEDMQLRSLTNAVLITSVTISAKITIHDT